MLGAISLQEYIMGMEDRFEISTTFRHTEFEEQSRRDPLGS